jgi:hypothetical protein
MAIKLSTRQQIQLAFLDAEAPKVERAWSLIERMNTPSETEGAARQLSRLFDQLKGGATTSGLPMVADAAGMMAMLARRGGGLQVKVRGLRDGIGALKHALALARKSASTPETDPGE